MLPPRPERKISIIGFMKGQIKFDDPYAGDAEIEEMFNSSKSYLD